MHPQWVETRERGDQFDIGLCRMDLPFMMIPGIVEAIAYPPQGRGHSGIATFYGWGSVSRTTQVLADILQTAELPIIQQEPCQQLVSNIFHGSRVLYGSLCTGPLDGSIGSCAGGN